MYLQQISDPKLAQYAYLIGCQEQGEAIIVDPQRDIDRYLQIAEDNGLRITAAADTHIHADYLSGLREFAELDGVTVYASGEGGDDWQYEWLKGSRYSHVILMDGDQIQIGNIEVAARHTPGHTPEHLSYLVTDKARDETTPLCMISGDFVFVGDVGRPDLLETAAHLQSTMVSSAEELFNSVNKFRELPRALMLLPGHGAGSACGKSLGAVPQSTVGYELATNPSLKAAGSQSEFVDYILRDQPEPPPYFARMKQINRSGPPVLSVLPRPRNIDLNEIDGAKRASDCVIVDTRPWEVFKAAHIPGSLFVPTTSAFSTLIGSYIDPDAVLCLVAEEYDLEEITRHCVRIGVDNVDRFITPDQLADWQSKGGATATVEEVSMGELLRRTTDNPVRTLDVRRSAELSDLPGIPTAINISHTQLNTRHRELLSDESYYLYCRTGNRSRYAAAFLKSKGFDVKNVTGGAIEIP